MALMDFELIIKNRNILKQTAPAVLYGKSDEVKVGIFFWANNEEAIEMLRRKFPDFYLILFGIKIRMSHRNIFILTKLRFNWLLENRKEKIFIKRAVF